MVTRKRRLKAGVFGLLVATQHWASGQATDAEPSAEVRDEEGMPTAVVDRIVVTASPEQTREVGGAVQFIDQETLSISQYSDPNRVLRQVPGVNLVEEDGYGLRPNNRTTPDARRAATGGPSPPPPSRGR